MAVNGRVAVGQESDGCIPFGSECNDASLDVRSSWLACIFSAALRNSVQSQGSFNADFAIHIFTILALLLPFIAAFLYRRIKMQTDLHKEPFEFLALPAELREMVYENLLEEPCYPARPQAAKTSAYSLSSLFPGRWGGANPSTLQPSTLPEPLQASGRKPSNWIFLANKQVYAEFMDLLVKKSTFHFSTYPENASPKAAKQHVPAPRESSPDTTSQSMTLTSTPPWFIAPSTLTRLRNCTLTLNVTSTMLGCADPRAMSPASWAFARSIKKQMSLSSTSSIQSLSLHVKAIGDPLWNPLWVWYHASQSFKAMGRLREIRFSLDTWSPGENHLKRDASVCSSRSHVHSPASSTASSRSSTPETTPSSSPLSTPSSTASNEERWEQACRDMDAGPWSWYCAKDHLVATESSPDVTVRQFCALLYQECLVCRPELEGSDGE